MRYLLGYHIPSIKKFPGRIGASRAPRRIRRAIRVWKFFANPVLIKTMPHTNWTTDIVFAIGSR